MYIPEPAVDALLTFMASASAPGSTFVADYFERSVIEGTCPLPEARALKAFVEQEGSALQFGFEEGAIDAYLHQRGFTSVTTVNAMDCKANYFPATDPGRSVSPMFNFVTARV